MRRATFVVFVLTAVVTGGVRFGAGSRPASTWVDVTFVCALAGAAAAAISLIGGHLHAAARGAAHGSDDAPASRVDADEPQITPPPL